MSLISLLIALAAERYLSSSVWQFSTLYQRYNHAISRIGFFADKHEGATIKRYIFIILPPLVCFLLLSQIHNALLYIIASTLVLIICFGCINTRATYKEYIESAFKGELNACQLQHLQLHQDKKISNLGFGQSLVWLNYRYFIAVMLFFVIFGPTGALFYRLLATVNETTQSNNQNQEQQNNNEIEVKDAMNRLLFWVDWLPVRIVAFGYMFVGHFSKAMPVWLENLFEFEKEPCQVLISVAEHSEDFMTDEEDCTSEPFLLVKLAKRTLLLFLSIISILVLTGVID